MSRVGLPAAIINDVVHLIFDDGEGIKTASGHYTGDAYRFAGNLVSFAWDRQRKVVERATRRGNADEVKLGMLQEG